MAIFFCHSEGGGGGGGGGLEYFDLSSEVVLTQELEVLAKLKKGVKSSHLLKWRGSKQFTLS